MTTEQFEALADDGFDFDSAWRAVTPDDVLCLIYTSGTTGPPKGVQLTHGNMMAEWRSLDPIAQITPGGRSISFLPSAHVADRWAQLYSSMVYGQTVHCCPNPRDMVAYSIEVKPTLWGGVPRIWEKLKQALEAGFAGEQDEEKKAAVAAAMKVGMERAEAKQAGEVPDELEQAWQQADEQVFSKIRAMLGLDECEWFAVGAAPTPPEVILFFDAMGIEIAELWGMSETCAVATLNPPGQDPRRHGGPADPRRGAEAGRGRGDPRARPDDHEGLPQPAREDRRGADRRRLAPDRRHRRARRGGLPQDRRPQEGADHQRGGQEHVAREHRGEDQGRLPAGRPGGGDRRPPALQHGADHARSRGRGRLHRPARRGRRDGRGGRRESRRPTRSSHAWSRSRSSR